MDALWGWLAVGVATILLARRAAAAASASAVDVDVRRGPAPDGAAPVWPVPGARMPRSANLRFGAQRSPTHVHRGTDIAAPEGSPVLAPLAGRVVWVVTQYTPGFRGYGKAVVLQTHTGYMLFAHLSRVDVAIGAHVEAGQQIGAVGRTSYTEADPTGNIRGGAHLHFELSATPYPQDAEAERLDSDAFLRSAAR